LLVAGAAGVVSDEIAAGRRFLLSRGRSRGRWRLRRRSRSL